MNQACACEAVDETKRRSGVALSAADGLAFAAAPAFLIMGLLSATGGPAQMLCTAAPVSPLGGMAAMYLLMSALHAAPWLKLIANRRGRQAGREVETRLRRPVTSALAP